MLYAEIYRMKYTKIPIDPFGPSLPLFPVFPFGESLAVPVDTGPVLPLFPLSPRTPTAPVHGGQFAPTALISSTT